MRPRLFTINHAAEILGISRRALYKRLEKNKALATNIDGVTFISRAALLSIWEERRKKEAPKHAANVPLGEPSWNLQVPEEFKNGLGDWVYVKFTNAAAMQLGEALMNIYVRDVWTRGDMPIYSRDICKFSNGRIAPQLIRANEAERELLDLCDRVLIYTISESYAQGLDEYKYAIERGLKVTIVEI